MIVASEFVNKKGKTKVRAEWTDQSDLSLSSSALDDGSITTDKINDSAVTSSKIADGTITSSDIADGAITSNKISSNAVTSDKISDGTVGTSDLADDAVTADKIASGVLSATFVVGKNGDFTDIQTAVDAIGTAGGSIFIREGTYNIGSDDINITKANLKIFGSGPATIISGTDQIFDIAAATNISISDLTASTSSSIHECFSVRSNSDNIRIENCVITEGNIGADFTSSCDLFKIISCSFSSSITGYIAIDCGGDNGLIANNNISIDSTTSSVGIRLGTGDSNRIIGNYISADLHGIYLNNSFGEKVVVSSNTVDTLDVASTAITSSNDHAVISGNMIDSNGIAIELASSATFNSVTGNTIVDGDVVSLRPSNSGHSFYGNVLASGTITVDPSDNSTQPGNTSGGSGVDDLDEMNMF